MTLLEILQERQQVHAEILDLRGKRGADGKFADAATETHFQKASQRFNELTSQKAQFEIDEAVDKEMVSREAETRARQQSTDKQSLTYERAFQRWLVQNPETPTLTQEERTMLLTREQRGTSTQIASTDSLGGYTVPRTQADRMETMMKWYGGWGAFGSFTTTGGGTHRMPSLDDTATNGAIIAQGVGTTVSDLTFGQVLWGDYTIDSKIIKMGAELMNDTNIDLVQTTIGELLPERLGRKVNALLTNGTGTSEPYGLTTTVTNSGGTTGGATAITATELIRLIHSVDKAYRYILPENNKVGFMMHDTIMAYLRTLDVGNTNTVQVFYPSLVGGEPDRLLGYPIFINNDLEAANATTKVPVTAKKHVYFGDFNKYKVRRIGGINMSRNDSLYWAERSVGFMGWLRIDGNLINANAIKSLLQA